MLGFIKNIFKGGSEGKAAPAEPATEYSGFSIVPCPQQGAGGWSTEAMITKEIDGETRSHHFIRADKTGDREGAITLTLNKCKMTIDQVGDGIFR